MKILGLEIRWPTEPRGCQDNPAYEAGEIPRGPHCDSLVVHHPADCDYCGDCTDAVVYRIHHNFNFTGESRPGRLQCPAEARRPLAVIHAWPGNRPMLKESE